MIIFKFCDLKLNEPAINRIQIIKKKATPNQFNLDESTKKIYEKLNFNEFSVLK